MARKKVPAISGGMRPSTGSASSSYSSPMGVFRPVNSGRSGKPRAFMAIHPGQQPGGRWCAPVPMVTSRLSGKPQGKGTHLDAHAGGCIGGAQRIVEGDVRHTVCDARLAVMSLEDDRFITMHVREPVPPVSRVM